jgi:predicted phosphodiesterase
MEIDILRKVITELPQAGRAEVGAVLGIPEHVAREYTFVRDNLEVIRELFENDGEIVEQNIKYKKEKQKFQDINRIERKSFRENARIENSIVEYNKKLMEVFDENPINIETIEHEVNEDGVGVVHLTDTHFNEEVDLESNQYNFNVASKRIKKLVEDAITYFGSKGIKKVVLAITGDLLNSDRRLDELLANTTNRSRATFLSVEILSNAIIELNKYFNVNIVSVVGNESRLGKDIGFSNIIATDNFDYTIYHILEYMFKGKDGINFISGDGIKTVVEINGYNWLFIHGHQIGKEVNKSISKLSRQYADKGIAIRFIIFGHIHECFIADLYARGSSLVGANDYSENGLLLTSRASQNLHIQYSNGNIDSFKIDLQNTGDSCYQIQEHLEAYASKSYDKLKGGETIFKVVI